MSDERGSVVRFYFSFLCRKNLTTLDNRVGQWLKCPINIHLVLKNLNALSGLEIAHINNHDVTSCQVRWQGRSVCG